MKVLKDDFKMNKMQSPHFPHKKGNRSGSESNQLIGYGFIWIETKQFISIHMWSTELVALIVRKTLWQMKHPDASSLFEKYETYTRLPSEKKRMTIK